MLSQKVIEEFIALYREEFEIELSIEDASELAGKLLRFYKTIFKPEKEN